MVNRLLNAEEAAQILRMETRTLIRWARLGYVPAHPLKVQNLLLILVPRAAKSSKFARYLTESAA
jgi:predicted site-specific integrase-resolvase